MRSAIPDKKAYLPVFIGAGVCLFLLRTGVFGFLFLTPLGFLAYRYDYRIAWAASLSAILGNTVLSFGMAVTHRLPLFEAGLSVLYFAVMICIFMWITAPPPGAAGKVPGVIRLLSGSCLGALVLSGIFFSVISSPGFSEYAEQLMSSLSSIYRSSGADVVEAARMEALSVRPVLETVEFVMLRGGAVISCALLFLISRQISVFLARVFLLYGAGRTHTAVFDSADTLAVFHVRPRVIWVFSASLFLVVAATAVKLEIPGIILWNILVLCAILYFAQGLGILQFFLARPGTPPFMRMLLSVLFVVLLFTPFLNMVLLGGVVLLGIAENWAPFRAPKKDPPPSTPEAGNDDYF